MDENYITLYNEDGDPIVGVRLSEKGMKYYEEGGRDLSIPGFVELMLDLRGIEKADF